MNKRKDFVRFYKEIYCFYFSPRKIYNRYGLYNIDDHEAGNDFYERLHYHLKSYCSNFLTVLKPRMDVLSDVYNNASPMFVGWLNDWADADFVRLGNLNEQQRDALEENKGFDK